MGFMEDCHRIGYGGGFYDRSFEEILAEKIIPEKELNRCRELGAAMGAGLSMGVF